MTYHVRAPVSNVYRIKESITRFNLRMELDSIKEKANIEDAPPRLGPATAQEVQQGGSDDDVHTRRQSKTSREYPLHKRSMSCGARQ